MAPCGGSGEGAADIEDISSPRTQVHKDIQLLSPYLIRYLCNTDSVNFFCQSEYIKE